MSDIAIRVEGLGKRYQIGAVQKRHDTLRDALVDRVQAPLKRLRAGRSRGTAGGDPLETANTFWALKEVSFEVKRGEVLGVIGRNGAGKSTLLKILSRITEPTEGRAVINGRIGSLLEVGTGFHPELTGRENIYLNGAILGMKRTEIERRFDEIVAFAEIEKFLDTPVKRYSSGMYVRLAFAVAAHLEPEILVVDEVLAVGDVAFQNKCLGKMDEVAKQGRTVLFVSHNMAAIAHLCTVGVVLHGGRIIKHTNANSAVEFYENMVLGQVLMKRNGLEEHVIYCRTELEALRGFLITKIELLDKNDKPKSRLYTWDTVKFRIHYYADHSVVTGSAVLQISTHRDGVLLLLSTQPDSNVMMQINEGHNSIDCQIGQLPLSAGDYWIGSGLAIPNKEWLYWNEHLGMLTVLPRDIYQSGLAPTANRSLLAIPHRWTL